MLYNGIEFLLVQAARQIKKGEVVFAGVGLPIMAMAVAKEFYHPDITIVCESGIVDTMPTRLALSIADPSLVANSVGVFTPGEMFSYFLQGGRIDVGVLGGAQVDRFGNLNTTVIGAYEAPKVRMPGSGGACEIASNAKEILILMQQGKRRYVRQVDFVTSPGHVRDPEVKRLLRGKGPRAIVSDMGVYSFEGADNEMVLRGIAENETLERIREETGWELCVANDIETLASPSAEELAFIRRLDPDSIFLSKQA